MECNPLLDEFQIVSETVKAIKFLLSGKALGSDAIPAEIYKAGGPPVCGEKKPALKNSRMHQFSIYSNGNGSLKSVKIMETSLYCQLLGRFL